VDPGSYVLVVEGLVDRPLRLKLEDLESASRQTTAATLQCAGNRRSEQSRIKPVGGVQWTQGAIGTAEWSGVRLSEILGKAGIKNEAKHLWFEGRDVVTLKDRQTLFGGGVPIAKAMKPECLIALQMNGRPLSPQHGAPARTLIPGFIGARSVKWLQRIVVSDHSSENNFVAKDYKLFPPEATAETVKPADYEPLYEFGLSSAICSPLAEAKLAAGPTTIRGWALPPGAEGAGLAKVEVSADGGKTWTPARFTGKDVPFAWRLWEADLTLAPGPATLVVRATDTTGTMQPETGKWNFKGYSYDGWHKVGVSVSA
jgi:sulfite oxidase